MREKEEMRGTEELKLKLRMREGGAGINPGMGGEDGEAQEKKVWETNLNPKSKGK